MSGKLDATAVAAKHDLASAQSTDEKGRHSNTQELPPVYEGKGTSSDVRSEESVDAPTTEDLRTLRRVTDTIPWNAYTIAFVELCERFSFYGTTVVCMFDGYGTSPSSITR